MIPIRHFISVLVAFFLCITAMAQVVFTTKISAGKIGKNETLEVNYEALEGGIQNFKEPRFPGWRLVGGPNYSSSTVITNGKSSSSMSYQFLLKPETTGTLTVPGAKATIDGKAYSSNAVTVEVKDQDVVNGNSTNSNAFDPFQMLPDMAPAEDEQADNEGFFLLPGDDPEQKTKANLFAVIEVSKKTCYPGEAIKASYKLYSRVNMEAHITRRPSFSGFSSIDMPDEIGGESALVKLKGKVYRVYPIRTVQLYPLQSGRQTLQPVEIDATVQYRKIDDINAYQADPFASTRIITHPYTVKSDTSVINVLPFPEEGKPADFNGVTGAFTIETAANYKDLAKKESGIFRVTVNGSGNWAMLQQPVINWPQSVDVFEPTVTEKLDSQAIPISGKRTYEFPFTCNKAGVMTIPAVTISYFDPVKKQYTTAGSQPITIDIKNTTTPLHQTSAVITNNSYTDGTEMFTGIVKVAFPIAALLLVGWFIASYSNRKKSKRQNAVFVDKYNKANSTNAYSSGSKYSNLLAVNKEASKEIKPLFAPAAGKEITVEKTTLLNEQAAFEPLSSKQYFTTVKGKINELLKRHLNIGEQPVFVTRQNLLQNGFSEDETNKIAQLLQLCEQHIYSPFAADYNMKQCDEMLREATGIISSRKNSSMG